MKSGLVRTIGIAFLLTIAISPFCMGIGFGAYSSWDYRLTTIGSFSDYASYTFLGLPDFKRVKNGQYGIIFDTNMARNSIFNYRLNLGLEFSNISFTDPSTSEFVTMEVWKLVFENTFGFGIMRTEMYRLWVGPQVGIGIGFEPSVLNNSGYYSSSSDFFEMDVHAGFVVGLNVHLGDALSICGDAGVRLHSNTMDVRSYDFSGAILDAFANVGLVLKANDVFEPPKTE
jgi:hypothetical protein